VDNFFEKTSQVTVNAGGIFFCCLVKPGGAPDSNTIKGNVDGGAGTQGQFIFLNQDKSGISPLFSLSFSGMDKKKPR
jgi:hypothetical protein